MLICWLILLSTELSENVLHLFFILSYEMVKELKQRKKKYRRRSETQNARGGTFAALWLTRSFMSWKGPPVPCASPSPTQLRLHLCFSLLETNSAPRNHLLVLNFSKAIHFVIKYCFVIPLFCYQSITQIIISTI